MSEEFVEALLLTGGGALCAYQGGAYAALDAQGIRPDWVAGVSMGAFNAAIIAGNPPGRRVERLRAFWEAVARPDGVLRPAEGPLRSAYSHLDSLETRLFGRPGLFGPRMPEWLAMQFGAQAGEPGYHDHSRAARLLEELIDFDRLAGAEPRLVVAAVDVESGLQTFFDSAELRLGVEHLLASAALPPFFPAVEIGGRAYWDGGIVCNAPLLDLLDRMPARPTRCYIADPYCAEGQRPRTMDGVQERRKDILFAGQTRQQIEAARTIARLRRDRPLEIVLAAYRGTPHDIEAKEFEYARGSLAERWQAGEADMRAAIAGAPGAGCG